MADWGFLISDYLENIGASLIENNYIEHKSQIGWKQYNGWKQLTKAEVRKSQAIASVRIYYAINITF